jgi:hypothetical protein
MVIPAPCMIGLQTMTILAQLSDLHLADDDPAPVL